MVYTKDMVYNEDIVYTEDIVYIKGVGNVSKIYLDTLRLMLEDYGGDREWVLGRGGICILTNSHKDVELIGRYKERELFDIGGKKFSRFELSEMRAVLYSMKMLHKESWFNVEEGICNNYFNTLVYLNGWSEEDMIDFSPAHLRKVFNCHNARDVNRLITSLGLVIKYPVGKHFVGDYESNKALYHSTKNKWEGDQLIDRLIIIDACCTLIDELLES